MNGWCAGAVDLRVQALPCPVRDPAVRLSLRADGEWLVELLIDFEEDEPARLHLVAALRGEG
jgi:hypothetical protein